VCCTPHLQTVLLSISLSLSHTHSHSLSHSIICSYLYLGHLYI
jgi:hypothetical protein